MLNRIVFSFREFYPCRACGHHNNPVDPQSKQTGEQGHKQSNPIPVISRSATPELAHSKSLLIIVNPSFVLSRRLLRVIVTAYPAITSRLF
jgi:hypothetical protein